MKILQGLLLAGVVATGSLCFGQTYHQDQSPANSGNTVTLSPTKVDLDNAFDYSVTDVAILDFLSDYIGRAIDDHHSIYFKTLESEFANYRDEDGRKRFSTKVGRENTVNSFGYIHRRCMISALEFKNQKVPDGELEELVNTIISSQAALSERANSGRIVKIKADYNSSAVRKTIKEWAAWKTWEFQKLVLASEAIPVGDTSTKEGREQYVRNLYQTGFTEAEYLGYLRQQDFLNQRIANALTFSITGNPDVEKNKETLAGREFAKMEKAGREARLDTYKKYFGKADK